MPATLLYILNVILASVLNLHDIDRNFIPEHHFDFRRLDPGLSFPHSDVNAVLQDSEGYVWVATYGGLCRYDGYRLRTFRSDNSGLSGDRILSLAECDGLIYVGTESGGLNVYDCGSGKIRQISIKSNASFISDESIYCIFGDSVSGMYVGCNSSLMGINADGSMSRRWTNPYRGVVRAGLFLSENRLVVGSANGLWLYDLKDDRASMIHECDVWCLEKLSDSILVGTANGLYVLDCSSFEISPLLKGVSIRSIECDMNGHLWVGTFNNGLIELDSDFSPVGHFMPNPSMSGCLSSAQVESLCTDRSGILWIGTNGGGLNFVDLKDNNIRLFNTQNGLSGERVMTFCGDDCQGLWVASHGGGIDILDPRTGRFSHLDINGTGSEFFPMILSLNTMDSGDIYIGTMEYGLWVVPSTQVLKMYRDVASGRRASVTAVKSSLTGDCSVFKVVQDAFGEIWISTNAGVFECSSGTVRRYCHDSMNQMSLWSDFVTDIFPDSELGERCVWVGTRMGLNRIIFRDGEPEPVVSRVSLDSVAAGRIQHKFISSIRRDSRGCLWVTTLGNGLYGFDDGVFRNYTAASSGFANNELECMEIDDEGRLWIAGVGIVCYDPATGTARRYSEKDNLQSDSFKMWASLRMSDGNMVFGGTEGFNIFHPDSIRIDSYCPAPLISTVSIGGKTVGDDAVVPYKDNSLSIGFSLPNYRHTESNSFRYRLSGFDDDWNYVTGGMPGCSYTNLPSGHYVFELYASNADGIECPENVTFSFTIRPPFWRSPLAYLLYFLAAALMGWGAWAFAKMQMKQREQRLLQEHKLMTFTDMAHEIRTPLSLISAPVEELLANPSIGQSTRSRLEIVDRSVKSLKSVVNQVLDLRKYEDNMMTMTVAKVNISRFLSEAAELFVPLARSRGIMFRTDIPQEPVEVYIDKYKMERVVVNLLSNAFKFTEEGGTVCLNCCEDDRYVVFSVEDNGVGISEKDQPHIFDRFYQGANQSSETESGTGIGLSLSKYIVAHHKGEISVESRPGFGSKFTVRLLKGSSHFKEDQIDRDYRSSSDLSNYAPVQSFQDIRSTYAGEKNATVLVVDDNDDFRRYLYELLSIRYNVLTADNGLAAYELAISRQPDLILSDIMMPKMSGMELCRLIKTNETTAQILVVLLTARDIVSTEVESYRTGADAFITKPFSTELLLTRVQALIDSRDKTRKSFGGFVEMNPSEVEVVSRDEQLVRRCLELVEQNMDDSAFGVDELCRAAGVSRPQLYRKIQAVTGESPVVFIRSIRLKRAAQILKEDSSSVSAVMFQVGFNSLSYFSKLFKEMYGCLPKEYSKREKEKNGNQEHSAAL